MEFCNILKYSRELFVKKLLVRYFGLCSLPLVQVAKKKKIYENSHLWGMFVSSSLCLLTPLFLDKCPQIKEIYPPLHFFEYTCLYIYIRYRTIDLMYCQNSYMQRSLSSYAESGTKSVWFLLPAFGETKGKWNKQIS